MENTDICLLPWIWKLRRLRYRKYYKRTRPKRKTESLYKGNRYENQKNYEVYKNYYVCQYSFFQKILVLAFNGVNRSISFSVLFLSAEDKSTEIPAQRAKIFRKTTIHGRLARRSWLYTQPIVLLHIFYLKKFWRNPKILKKIESLSEHLSDKIGDIIWSVKPEAEEFLTFIYRIKNFVSDCARFYQYTLSYLYKRKYW